MVKEKIFSWASENKGKILTEKSDGTKIKIALLTYIYPLKNYLVVNFFKTNNIIFELKPVMDEGVVVINGEGYITNGRVEINFDQTKVWGFVPRRKGYELLENLKSRFVG